jgi:hypothetical protein
MFGLTVMVIVAVVAHNPAVGVKVYKVVAALLSAGDHVPVMPFAEEIGKAAKVPPAQIGATWVNVGVMFGFTVMVIVAVVAHNPAVGVKVYKVVAALFMAGDHVPVMLLVEEIGKAAKVAPAQIGATCVNKGVTFGLTVMVIVAVVAHNPAVGVKVYKVVAALLSAGDHVPVMLLFEVVGRAAKVAPAQIGATCVNSGVTFGLTVMVIVAVVAHNPAVGVKVYKVVAALFMAGDHVPVMLLVEEIGKAAKVAPEQIGAT